MSEEPKRRGPPKGSANARKGGVSRSAKVDFRIEPPLLLALEEEASREGVSRGDVLNSILRVRYAPPPTVPCYHFLGGHTICPPEECLASARIPCPTCGRWLVPT